MKDNASKILIYIFLITFAFLACERDGIVEIEPLASLQLELKSSQSKIDFPDSFEAKIEILKINQTSSDKPVKTDSITFVRQDLGNHKSQGSIEVPFETSFVIVIYANIDEFELFGKTDTIFISNETVQAFVAKVYLSTGQIILDECSVVDVGFNSALVSSKIIDNGGKDIIEYGFVWNTDNSVAIDNNIGSLSENSDLFGSFQRLVDGLNPNTTYYIAAYASNGSMVEYSEIVSFSTTENATPIVLTTDPIIDITSNSATASATFTDDGGHVITEKGFVWATFTNPEIPNNEGLSMEGGGVSDFSSSLSGLADGTVYYVRSYAETAEGELFYGNQVSFTTVLLTPPQAVSFLISEVLLHSARITVNVGSDGGSTIVSKGIVFSQTPNPDIDNNEGITDEGGGVSEIESLVSGLNAGVVYYAKCYAINEIGVAYSDEFSFTTLTIGDIGPGGGIIFYDDGISNGLEVGDLSSQVSIQWGCASLPVMAVSPLLGDGLSNTQAIVTFHNDLTDYFGNPAQCDPTNDGTVAAIYCDSYEINSYDDWFLPSLDELLLIYSNLHAVGTGDFSEDFYWSSTEADEGNARAIDFMKGTDLNMYKYNTFLVRPVRKF